MLYSVRDQPASLAHYLGPRHFGGKPIIRGQRFAVEHLLGYLGAGMCEAELLAQFPFLQAEDIVAARLFASQNEA